MATLQVYSGSRSPHTHQYIKEEEVELFARPSANGAHMLLFVCQLQDRLRRNNPARIMEMVSSCDEGTMVSARVRPGKMFDFLKLLRSMDIVDTLTEGSNGYRSFPGVVEKILHCKASEGDASKRICVTLKQSYASEC